MPRKDPEARKAYQKEYAAKNKGLAYERVKEWRKNNPERWAEQRARYQAKYPDKSIVRAIKWKKENPERYSELARRSRKKHYERVVANKAKYRAAKSNRFPPWLNKGHKFEILCVYTYRNALRNIGLDYEVDHIVPLQGELVSGLHVPWNLQIITAQENRVKNNGWP